MYTCDRMRKLCILQDIYEGKMPDRTERIFPNQFCFEQFMQSLVDEGYITNLKFSDQWSRSIMNCVKVTDKCKKLLEANKQEIISYRTPRNIGYLSTEDEFREMGYDEADINAMMKNLNDE